MSIPGDGPSSRRLPWALERGPRDVEPQRCDSVSVHGERAPPPGGGKGGCMKEDRESPALLQDVSRQARKGLGGRCRGQACSRLLRRTATELGGGGDGSTGSDHNGPGRISELRWPSQSLPSCDPPRPCPCHPACCAVLSCVVSCPSGIVQNRDRRARPGHQLHSRRQRVPRGVLTFWLY